MKKLLTLLAFFISASSIAQNTFQTFDIVPGQQGSSPLCLTPFNGRLYFYATDENYNQQIWSTDGNSAPVKTMALGKTSGSARHIYTNPKRCMAVIGNKLYFAGRDAKDTVNIYYTDGTNTSGIKLNATFPNPHLFTIFKNQLYFAYISATGSGWEIYRLNPTDNNITRVTGLSQTNNVRFNDIVELNGKLMISGNDNSANSYKLWEYNPTNNTTIVIDSNYLELGKILVVDNNILYYKIGNDFKIYTGSGNPLMITRMDVTPEDGAFMVDKGTVFYTGTAAITGNKSLAWKNTINQLNKQLKGINGSNIDGIKMFGKYLASTVFITNDIYQYNNTNIWLLNGTDTPLSLANSADMSVNTTELVEFNGSLYFISSDAQNGVELTRYTNASLNTENLTNTTKASFAYPNPAKDYINLDFNTKEPQEITISITDMSGRIVYTMPAATYHAPKHTIQIPIQSLSSGIYNYAINNGNVVLMASGQFVKE
ncbi:MAG: T9SS type A sorting domain-containing protein [Flavipsychrobacter sp.]